MPKIATNRLTGARIIGTVVRDGECLYEDADGLQVPASQVQVSDGPADEVSSLTHRHGRASGGALMTHDERQRQFPGVDLGEPLEWPEDDGDAFAQVAQAREVAQRHADLNAWHFQRMTKAEAQVSRLATILGCACIVALYWVASW